MFYLLIILQIIAHLVADFYCQTNKFCERKEKGGFFSAQLYVHSLVVFIFSWLCSLTVEFWWAALCIAVSHLFLDGLKVGYKNIRGAFFIDQLFHLVIIVLFSYIFTRLCSYIPLWQPNVKWLLITVGLIMCLKPANIFIRELFRNFNLMLLSPNKNDLPNAGKLIGSAERLLAYIFVLLGQYEALGFLIAAKSILRFRDTDTAKTEYVLVGTLLSFSIAIVVGVLVNIIIANY